jgi:hypothetical protein
MNEVGNSFGLREIYFAVQEGAPCELPGLSLPRAKADGCFKKLPSNEHPAVAAQFHDIFPGIGVRLPENKRHDIVNGPTAAVNKGPKMGRV